MASLTDLRNRINSRGKVPQRGPAPGVDLAAATYTPLLPSVNLLPNVFAQRQANRGLVRRFVWVAVAVALVMALAVGAKFVVQFFQQSELANLQSTAATYSQQLQALTPYQNYKDGIATERTTLAGVLQNDLDMSKILTTLNNQASRHQVKYSAIGLTVGSASGGCISDPFASQATVGCITVSGGAPSQSDISNFFNDLNGTTGFLNAVPASLSAASGATPGVTGGYSFNGSVSFNQAFYSQKYADLSLDINSALGGGGSAGTTPVLQSLKSNYPTVFATTTSAQATTFATQVCSAAIPKVTISTLNSSVINAGNAIGVTITNDIAAQVAKTAVGAQCPNQTANLPGGTA